MSDLTVYVNRASTCSRGVITHLLATGVSHDLKVLDFAKGEHKAPEYVKDVNPEGQVPALKVGDTPLTESLAIHSYLADVTGATTTPLERAHLARALQFANGQIHKHYAAIVLPALFTLFGAPLDLEKQKSGYAPLKAGLEKLENTYLKEGGSFLSEKPLPVDYYLATDIYAAFTFAEVAGEHVELGYTLEEFPKVAALVERVRTTNAETIAFFEEIKGQLQFTTSAFKSKDE